MPNYRMRVTIEYDAKTEDSGDRYHSILSILEDIPGVRIEADEELGAVLRTPGDDCE